MKAKFTHYWVSGFGWEPTVFQQEYFVTVEKLGENKEDGVVFLAINESGGKHILKGSIRKYDIYKKGHELYGG